MPDNYKSEKKALDGLVKDAVKLRKEIKEGVTEFFESYMRSAAADGNEALVKKAKKTLEGFKKNWDVDKAKAVIKVDKACLDKCKALTAVVDKIKTQLTATNAYAEMESKKKIKMTDLEKQWQK